MVPNPIILRYHFGNFVHQRVNNSSRDDVMCPWPMTVGRGHTMQTPSEWDRRTDRSIALFPPPHRRAGGTTGLSKLQVHGKANIVLDGQIRVCHVTFPIDDRCKMIEVDISRPI